MSSTPETMEPAQVAPQAGPCNPHDAKTISWPEPDGNPVATARTFTIAGVRHG